MIKRFFSQEWAKLKEMNFTDKRQYIWEYYKAHIFMLGFAAFMIGSLINIWFINPPRQDYLYIAWQAGHVHTDRLDAMGEQLGIIIPAEGRYRVTVQSYVLVNEPQVDEALIMRFSALITVGDLHATITSSQGILEGAELGLLGAPEAVLEIIREYDVDFYEYLNERLLYLTYTPWGEEDLVTESMALRIGGAPMFTEMGIMSDDLYLGIIVNSRQTDGIARAIKVMFGVYQPEEYTA